VVFGLIPISDWLVELDTSFLDDSFKLEIGDIDADSLLGEDIFELGFEIFVDLVLILKHDVVKLILGQFLYNIVIKLADIELILIY
jgi:hypothetical protein